ncbi:hypothetical protein FB451DRAFT_1566015 [Mycena latifolia]|nr:hypothetical protein FB451DRAFT_1566015 [Mycena latifolia]
MLTSSLPQELWDDIMERLEGLVKDLKSCSLVCRSFVPRAQSHIFRRILVRGPEEGKAIGRLAAILSSSSCLVSYVQDLDIETCAEESLSPNPVLVALEQIHIFMELHSLPRLEILGNAGRQSSCLAYSPTATYNSTIFYPCWNSFAPSRGRPGGSGAAQSRRLSLELVPNRLSDMHLHPACPLDFSALTDVLYDSIDSLDLSLFPAVTCIWYYDRVLPTVSRKLLRLPSTNRGGIISFWIYLAEITLLNLRELAEAILAGRTPVLRRVKVDVHTSPLAAAHVSQEDRKKTREILQGALPLLHARGLLFVNFY